MIYKSNGKSNKSDWLNHVALILLNPVRSKYFDPRVYIHEYTYYKNTQYKNKFFYVIYQNFVFSLISL